MKPLEEIPAELLNVAQREADLRGWTWRAPVHSRLQYESGARVWSIRTNAHSLGSNIRMKIRESDQAILEAVFLPR
jgi:hypothetical protein